jgi:hypothetical protein
VKKTYCVISLFFLILFLGVSYDSGYCYQLLSFESDTAFLTFQNAGNFTKHFGANARWGYNETPARSWEYSVVNAIDTPLDQKEFVWNNTQYTYNLTVNSAADTVSFNINNGDDSFFDFSQITDIIPNALVIRASATDIAGGAQRDAEMQSIIVNFTSGGSLNLGQLVGDNNAQYIMLIDDRLMGGFTVAGEALLAVTSGTGIGSDPMYQFKVGNSPIPEPATLLLLGAGLGGIGLLRRRFKN